jgi:hypothetical protein
MNMNTHTNDAGHPYPFKDFSNMWRCPSLETTATCTDCGEKLTVSLVPTYLVFES